MVASLSLPRLLGTRQAAAALFQEQDLPHDLLGESLVVLCREVASATISSLDELLIEAFDNRKVEQVLLVGASDELRNSFSEVAERHKVASRVLVKTALDAGV